MTYIIFGDYFTFPEGTASTNRVYVYAKGLIENGIRLSVSETIIWKNTMVNQMGSSIITPSVRQKEANLLSFADGRNF
jgi:hypothetical protein